MVCLNVGSFPTLPTFANSRRYLQKFDLLTAVIRDKSSVQNAWEYVQIACRCLFYNLGQII